MRRQTISACLIVHDEERHIRECIESLSGAVDEVVVLHHGPCSDNTLAIARAYTRKVWTIPRVAGSCELVRHVSFANAKSDWVLVIDADERLSPRLRRMLPRLAQRRGVDAYSFLWPYYDEKGRRLEWKPVKYKKVLFRKRTMYSLGMPHGIAETRGRTKNIDAVLEHHFRNAQEREHRIRNDLRKNIVRARIGARLLSGQLDRIPTFRCSFDDQTLRQRWKFLFERNAPLVAIFVLPVYSFLHWYVWRGYWREGRMGVANALNLPLYHLFLCWFLLREKMRTVRP